MGVKLIIKDEVNIKLEGLPLDARKKLANNFKYEIMEYSLDSYFWDNQLNESVIYPGFIYDNRRICSKIYLPSHIANNILYKAIKENVNDITPIKLIKLVYFVYAWSLALFDRKLFEEEIEAWNTTLLYVSECIDEWKKCQG